MRKLFYIILFFFVTSCNNIDFIYTNNSNLINPLYEKTKIDTSGIDLNFLNSYIPMFFGENKTFEYRLLIDIEEERTKRSIKTNQATSNLRYELRFFYTLISNISDCITYEKEILSSFSIIPKSAGYNYGTDASLEKKYQIAVVNNLNQFVSFVSSIDINECT